MEERRAAVWWTALLCVFACSAVPNASAQTSVIPTEVSVEFIQQQRAALEADVLLAEDTRSRALELYDRALSTLAAAGVMATRAAALVAVLDSAEERTVTLRERLSMPLDVNEVPDVTSDESSEGLQTLVNERRTDLRIAQETLEERENVLANFVDPGVTYGDRLAELEQQLRRTLEEMQASSASQEAPAFVAARYTFLLSRQRLQESEIALIRLGQGNHDTLVRLYTLERDVAAADLARLEPQLNALDALLQERRADEARAATAEAEASLLAAADMPLPVAALAEENTRLRAELEETISAQSQTDERLRTTEQNEARIESELARIRKRIEVAGPSEAIGRLLRRRLQLLPTIEDYLRVGSERQDDIHRASDRRIDIEEAQREFADPIRMIESILAAAGPDIERFDAEQVRAQTETLLTVQQNTLGDLRQEYDRYVTRLAELDAAELRLRALLSESVDFVNKQLFWIKNLPPFSFSDVNGIPRTLAWLFSVGDWKRALEDGTKAYSDHPASSILTVFALFGLFYVRRQTSRELTRLSAQTKQIRTDKFSHTVKAMFFTLIAASSWPLLFLITGWHIRAEPFGEPFSAIVGRSLMYAATYWFILSLWWWVLHPEGLGRRHFRWALPVTSDLAKQFHWFAWVLLPGVFILAATNLSGDAEYIKDLGRPVLVLLMLAVAVFVWRSFGPASPFTEHFRHQHHGGWMGRMQFLWLPLYIAISATLAVASLLGYDYTAVQLLRLLLATIFYLVALWILKEVLLRWFYVAERRLRLQEAMRRREEMRAQQKEEDKADSEAVEIEVPGVDYKSLGEQGRAIVQVAILISGLLAMWLLWGDLLPAFSFITDVPLPFNRVRIIDGLQQNVPVTVGTFAVGLLVLLGTLFATRNLSGLLELTLLSRLGLDSGRRYAAITLSRYLIITVGIIVALSIIGLQWSKLSWLIAAMGVGLGFGLQEIVANFVSGIILLIERPIRIGDMVSVGDSTGTVARIQIRATTIITLERKELLVPNKEFVTGRVLNWTLSNEQMRLLVKVGIAYGSDVGKAMELIMQAAGENERVLDDPYPVVTFEEFGDNSLELSLRAFIASVETRLTTSTELNQAIYEKFNEAGITIAFPQRDVHLDTSAPLEVNITHEQ